MKRIDGKTPFGGDYAEFHFLDAENNEVDEGEETSIVIRECKADGNIPREQSVFLLQKYWDLRPSEAKKAIWQAENRAKKG